MVKRWLRIALVLGYCSLPVIAPGQDVKKGEAESTHMTMTNPTSGAPSPEIADTAQGIINDTNSFRLAEGLQAVQPNPQLMEAAQNFAQFMASTDQYGHTADGNTPAQRAQQHGYNPCIISENIAYQYRTSGFTSEALGREYVQGWQESPEHRKNMLNPAVTETGVGVAQSEQTGYYYAVQMFGRPQSEMIEFSIANRTNTAISYVMDSQTFALPPRSTRTHQQCQLAEITFQWPGKQEQIAVHPRPGEQYTILQEDSELFRLQKD